MQFPQFIENYIAWAKEKYKSDPVIFWVLTGIFFVMTLILLVGHDDAKQEARMARELEAERRRIADEVRRQEAAAAEAKAKKKTTRKPRAIAPAPAEPAAPGATA